MESCKNLENEGNNMEMEMLKGFKKNLSDILQPEDTDIILLKWLRARNFHLRRSETLFRENMKTREVHKVNDLEDIWEAPEAMQKYEFSNYMGSAKDGTPILYVSMGRADLRGFIMSADGFDIGKYCSVILENGLKKCREQSQKLGKEIHQVTYIMDMEGFPLISVMNQSLIEVAIDLLRILQDHYPEVWRNLLVVNAPPYFHIIFNMIKPILRNSLLKYIQVVSREQTAELLLKYVDADILPAFLGGTRVDSAGNSMCTEFMKFGGIIPEEYYLRNLSPLLASDKDAVEICIQPRGAFNYPVVIRQPGSMIRLEFRTEGGSIGLTVLYRTFGIDPENPDLPSCNEYLNPHDEKCDAELVSPSGHFQTHFSPVNNCCFAPWPGIYIFRFENSYGWLTSRKLIYRLRVQDGV